MYDKEKRREYDRRRKEKAKPAYDALMSCYPFTLDDLDGEQWKPIAGYDKYEVSNYGRVKSFWKKTPLIRKPALLRDYLSVDIPLDGEKKRRSIHVLVAQAFIPNPENKPEVNHIVGCKFNCHVSNLYWATRAENMQHAFDTGLAKSAQGVDVFNAKIKNEAGIIYIRENPDNLSRKELAEMFGINERTISAIQTGKTYENAGGTIRKKIDRRIPDEIREQIRADWATGQYTQRELAEKYGVGQTSIRRIINEPAA